MQFAVAFPTPYCDLVCVSSTFNRICRHPDVFHGHNIVLRDQDIDGSWPRVAPLLYVWKFSHLSSLRLPCEVDPVRRRLVQKQVGEAVVADSWCEHVIGKRVSLCSPRHRTARRNCGGLVGDGVLIGSGALRDRRFSIRVLKGSSRLDFGFTMVSPHVQGKSTRKRFAEDLLRCWIVESSGLLVGSHPGVRLQNPNWDVRQVMENDVVTLEAALTGHLHVFLNGEPRGFWPAHIPEDADLFPVVDIFEGDMEITLEDGEKIRSNVEENTQ